MKISSWNVNGIRSVYKTTFKDWVKNASPDIICLQEVKADSTELPEEITVLEGYYSYFNSAQKKGYSGVAVFTKKKPLAVATEIGVERFDNEGRCLKLTFDNFVLFNFYIPNGGRLKENMGYKLEVYDHLIKQLSTFSQKNVILAGDFNIAHTEIDQYYPKQNKNNTMFTPEERKKIDDLIRTGYIDSFRTLHPSKKSYTWWPYMNELRQKDIGWRIDYIFVSTPLKDKLREAYSEREVLGSDHGPFTVIVDIDFKKDIVQAQELVAQPALFT